MFEIRKVRLEDKEFWFSLDKHLSEQEFKAQFDFTLANKGEFFDSIAVMSNGQKVESVDVVLKNNTLTLEGILDSGNYIISTPQGALCDNVGGVNNEIVIGTWWLQYYDSSAADVYADPSYETNLDAPDDTEEDLHINFYKS